MQVFLPDQLPNGMWFIAGGRQAQGAKIKSQAKERVRVQKREMKF
jgi:hypothetical protein